MGLEIVPFRLFLVPHKSFGTGAYNLCLRVVYIIFSLRSRNNLLVSVRSVRIVCIAG